MTNRLFFLQLGAEHVPKSLSLRGGPETLYWEPFIAAVVETDLGWILLDSGMSRAAFDSDEIAAVYGVHDPAHLGGVPPIKPVPSSAATWAWIRDGDPLETALAQVGLSTSDLAMAAISHLHVDHSGGIPTLTRAGVPIVIQRAELAFVRSGAVGPGQGFFPPDWEHHDTVWTELDGDAELAPGVRALSTPGHTPGHMSFVVDLEESGRWVLAGDAADLAQNFLDGVPCGSAAGGTETDERDADDSFDRLFQYAREGARIIPGHDQFVFNAVAHPAGGHR